MRTTVNLPADLHLAVASIAAQTGRSMSQTIAELIRRGLTLGADANANAATLTQPVCMDSNTGFPLIQSPRPVSAEDVRTLDDE
ncbi:MAG: hypothetical protein KF778_12205 [Rhodocyclaceae bacterium]|nr:hypothetical protein [Rhodocyclaceae bacterium]MBX3669161.1 hypothetical protein [Rhodocyclaceae bacterium]